MAINSGYFDHALEASFSRVAYEVTPFVSLVSTCSRVAHFFQNGGFKYSSKAQQPHLPSRDHLDRAILRILGTGSTSILMGMLFLSKVWLLTQPLPHVLMFTAIALTLFNIGEVISFEDHRIPQFVKGPLNKES